MDCITNCSPASHFFWATQPRCGGGAPASGIWSFRAVVLKNPKIRCTYHMQFVLGIPFVPLNKKRVTATGCPEARKCDAGPRVIGNNTLGISFAFRYFFISLLVPLSLTFLSFYIPFLHSVFLFQFRKQYTRLYILLLVGSSIGNIAEQEYYFLNHLGVHSGLIATSACIRMPCTYNTRCSHIRIADPSIGVWAPPGLHPKANDKAQWCGVGGREPAQWGCATSLCLHLTLICGHPKSKQWFDP